MRLVVWSSWQNLIHTVWHPLINEESFAREVKTVNVKITEYFGQKPKVLDSF